MNGHHTEKQLYLLPYIRSYMIEVNPEGVFTWMQLSWPLLNRDKLSQFV